MEDRFDSLERRVHSIEERNVRVEKDKAWERSVTRIGMLAIITYAVSAFAFWILGNEQFLVNALVPMAAFVLSVQSLPIVKKWWIRKKRQNS